MTAKPIKIAEFVLVDLGSIYFQEPGFSSTVLLMSYQGKVLAVRKGQDKYAMPLGKFYNGTAEGIYLLKHIKGRARLEQLDGAVIKHQKRAGTATSMSGKSTWSKIWFRNGRTDEFID